MHPAPPGCPTCLSLEGQAKEEGWKTVAYGLLVSERGTFSEDSPNNLEHIEHLTHALETEKERVYLPPASSPFTGRVWFPFIYCQTLTVADLTPNSPLRRAASCKKHLGLGPTDQLHV